MQVLKRFRYSTDGITSTEAEPGDQIDNIPAELCAGLLAEGYIGEALENKTNLVGAPEKGDPVKVPAGADMLEELRADYLKLTGTEADKRWSPTTLRDKIIEA